MGNNYNFKFNPEDLSSKKIEEYKDFDALLEKFKSEPPSKPKSPARIRRLVYISGAIAAGIAVLWVILTVAPNTKTASPEAAAKAYFASQAYVNPPIPSIQPEFVRFDVDAESGGEILYASGSKLVIPRQAFMNDRGENVSGEVAIRFRELTDYIDFFLSGIPMTYDSAGVQYHLESAGMLEIYAEQNGRLLQLAPGKNIEVFFVSEILVQNLNEVPQFNVYQLDTASRNWTYRGVDQIEFLDEISIAEDDPLAEAKKTLIAQLKNIDKQKMAALAELEANLPTLDKPLQPFPNDPDIPTFELDFPADAVDSEVAALHAQTVWQLSPKNAPFDENMLATYQWDISSIEKINNQEYEIVLRKPDQTLRILASPVLIGEDYQNAMSQYERDLADYEARMAQRENQLQREKEAIDSWGSDEKQSAISAYEEQISQNQFVNTSPSSLFRRKITNRFVASSLGIWNCDRPFLPEKMELNVALKGENGQIFQNTTAFVVDKAHNTVYRYYAAKGQPLKIDEQAKNLLWVVTEEEKIALFQAAPNNKNDKELVLSLVDENIQNESDVRRALAF